MIVKSRSLRPAMRQALLIGVSVGTLMVAGIADAEVGRMFGGRGGNADPAAAAARAAQANVTRQAQSSSASRRAVDAFRRAAQTRGAMREAQAAARAAALAAQSSVPNGLGQGGLQVANGVALDPNLWIGAKGPVQSQGANGRTTVSIDQNQQQAILTWDSFSVGRETDLKFNQGGADWVSLNRVTDAGADPSKILGTISAPGSVYILNRNGILFGGASQVNVRNLIASTARISNEQLLARGIYSQVTGSGAGQLYLPSFTGAGGAVTVEAGAQLSTLAPTSVTAGGGFVLLMGTSVINKGTITTPRGQAALSAGDDFIIRRGFGTQENLYSTTRGNEVRGTIATGSTSGTVVNAGLIEAAQGDITLAGRTIRQDGVTVATTGVSQRGTIHLLNAASDAQGSVTLGKDSLTLILPDLESKDTALNGQRDALITQSEMANSQRATTAMGGFDDRSLLADRLDQSRVEIVTGGNVLFEGGSQTIANGGQVAVQATNGRITVADGARVDVSGVMGVALNMADNSIVVNVQGNELRDSPTNRESAALKSQNVWIDVRDLVLMPAGTGGYEGDRWYTPGGLLEVGGYLSNMAHGVGEWAAVGGTITLAGKEVVAHKGAVFDISGGSLDYAAGWVRSTRVMGSDGRMYDIRNAPSNLRFVSIGNGFLRRHDRWGEQYSEVYSNPLFSRGNVMRWEGAYSVGRDAGRLILSTPTAIMEADILAEAIEGDRQVNVRADGIADGYKVGQHMRAQAGSLVFSRYAAYSGPSLFNSDVKIGEVTDVTAGLATGGVLPGERTNTAWFDADRLNAAGLGGVRLETRGAVSIDSDLKLADGGTLAIAAPNVDIRANVTARGGSVSATNLFTGGVGQGTAGILLDSAGVSKVMLHEGATVDLRGLWVNTALNAQDASKLGLIDGGSVNFQTTHDIVLEKGSMIDVSSGGALLALGETRGGRGGDVTLIADLERSEAGAVTNGLLSMNGDIAAFGVSGGGVLKIESGTAISIGGKLLATDGVLGKGEVAPFDVSILEAYTVRKGEKMPLLYQYVSRQVDAGQMIGGAPAASIKYTLGADWTAPTNPNSRGSYYIELFDPVTGQSVSREYVEPLSPKTYPKGTILSMSFTSWFPISYIVPADVFPNGMTLQDGRTISVGAGLPAPVDITFDAGTVFQGGAVLERSVQIARNTQANLFQSGFSSYDITARNGVVVTDNSRLAVAMPVYRFTGAAAGMETGADPADAMELWTPPLYLEDPVNGVLTQRAGASLALRSTRTATGRAGSDGLGAGGPVIIRPGAEVTVDPGQSISLAGFDVRIDGRLNAWGGAINIDNALIGTSNRGGVVTSLLRIGAKAVLDVAARPALAIDQYGNRYGIVADGGTIRIGGGMDWEDTGEAFAPNSFVAIEKGALLDASGASAVVDIRGGGMTRSGRTVTLASDGGTIVVKSNQALYLDGTMRAAAGGEGAAGGTLALALQTPIYNTLFHSGELLNPREFILSNVQRDSIPAIVDDAFLVNQLKTGIAHVGADRIMAGGFDNLSLFAHGALSFETNFTLGLDQSMRLYANGFAQAVGAANDSRISLTAPYVRLAGVTRIASAPGDILPHSGWRPSISPPVSEGVFGVKADLIDIRDTVGFGAAAMPTQVLNIIRPAFGMVDLDSSGDIRLLQGLWRADSSAAMQTQLVNAGSMTLTAAQIYPGTDTQAKILVGDRGDSTFVPGTSLTIRRSVQGDVAMPYSAFGSLSLEAATINQGGIVRAPFGQLILGPNFNSGTAVNLLAGSITSVSGAGLVMPYGGSVDGINYFYDGREVVLSGLGAPIGKIRGSIAMNTNHLLTEKGSLIDLSGGGELTGAAFVSGRGGSVDILRTPLINANPGYGFSSAGNRVYAIVPTHDGYAPIAGDAGAGDPLPGQQITIAEGVPGLAAGTYMLMPSVYALQPGAFRVEIGAGNQAGLRGAASLLNGSYTVAGTLGIANSAIRDTLPSQVIITPGEVVRGHSGYNETSYDAFVRGDAARLNVPRAVAAADAANLNIALSRKAAGDTRTALSIAGEIRQAPAANSDGFASIISVGGVEEVLATGGTAATGLRGFSVYADDLSALGAARLVVNGSMARFYGPTGRIVTIGGQSFDLTVRGGAEIVAGDIILSGARDNNGDHSITIEEGASIIARGGSLRSFDSRDGFVFSSEGAVVVSNGSFNMILAEKPTNVGDTGLNIRIGTCITDACDMPTRLVATGTIALATNRVLTIADNVEYGAKNLVLAVSSVNLGEDAAISAAGAAGRLPEGLVLNQAKLATLLKGNSAVGVPALETLVLNARDAVNVYGSVDLDASGLQQVVFGAPAIYGYGAAGDVATIRAGEFIWTGSDRSAGAPMAGQLGHGALDVQAKSILFGYGMNTQPSNTVVDQRLALGFSTVTLTASERITASANSVLAVYETRGDYVTGKGWTYGGGNLTLAAPLVTGTAAARFDVKAGGDVTIRAPEATAALPAISALGAQIAIAGRAVAVDAAVVLPSGRLTLTATGDLTLGDRARIDLSGREIRMIDLSKYSWGGDLLLSSTGGNIRAATGSIVDLSAVNNRGGTMAVTALGVGAGRVDLAGGFKGEATGQYDAGGTIIPFDGAELTVRAQSLADFAGLNTRLNAGGLFGARRFQIKQGDLVIGDEVKARDVQIILDGGSMTVNGRIDASGFQTGSIRLAALGDLTIGGTLDAHGTGLRLDSYGKIIDSPNRAVVDLTSRGGTLTLANSAVVDLRAGTAVQGNAGGNDGVARGTLDLNAMRVGTNDVAVNVVGTLNVTGAKTIAVNAFRTYDDAPLAALPDVSGTRPQIIDQSYLDGIDGQSRAFIDAALGNAGLAERLAGLGNGYHLRPGVEIVSATLNGNLTVSGDIDLSGYRYGPAADRIDPALRGMGEPGVLVLRAGGALSIHGSINDGFAPPPATPDDTGWVLSETRGDRDTGATPFGGDITVPIDGVVLDIGTTFQPGATLNYDVPVGAVTLPSGTVLPVDAVLNGTMNLSAGTVVAANIYGADGNIAYAAGMVLGQTVTLSAGMRLSAGMPLNAATAVRALTWPKGVRMPVQMATAQRVTLARGALIPSMTKVELVGDAPIDLRPEVNGVQGRNWAVAPMLGDGATSWDMQLTAGADLGSVDGRAVDPMKSAAIVLADQHQTMLRMPDTFAILLGAAGIDRIIADNGLPPGFTRDQLIGMSPTDVVVAYGGLEFSDFGYPADFLDPSNGHLLIVMNATGLDYFMMMLGGYVPAGYTQGQLLGKSEAQLIAIYAADGVVTWDDFGLPSGFWDSGSPYVGLPGTPGISRVSGQGLSVVRTGTGDLGLSAAGDIAMKSLYGVYTAGTATGADAIHNLPRGAMSDGSLLGGVTNAYDASLAAYRAWYPDQGGNLLISAGGNLTGDIREAGIMVIPGGADTMLASSMVGNWLWRQGSGTAKVDRIATAWWINFGSYGRTLDDGAPGTVEAPQTLGFTGFGTLGGGDVTIRVDGNAGKLTLTGQQSNSVSNIYGRTQGLVVAVGSTGRVNADGSLTLTGGGDLDMRIAGALNPLREQDQNWSHTAGSGSIVNLRGSTQVAAASIGAMQTIYASSQLNNIIDPRGVDPFATMSAWAVSGPTFLPGDSAVYVQTLGDLVTAGAADPTRVYMPYRSVYRSDGTDHGDAQSWFTLWTDHTAMNLTSAGGNMAPSKGHEYIQQNNVLFRDMVDGWPAILRVTAMGGSMFYGGSAGHTDVTYTQDVLMPSASSELSILAAGSIYGGRRSGIFNELTLHGLVLSATGTAMPTPFNPAFVGFGGGFAPDVASNLSPDSNSFDSNSPGVWNMQYSLFALGANTVTTMTPRPADAPPIRIYARDGDIVGLSTGQARSFNVNFGRTIPIWYSGGAPMRMIAGRDIVSSGSYVNGRTVVRGSIDPISGPFIEGYRNYIVHSNATDVSVISAGRDILYSNFDVAGPGVLEVTAGRNILQEDYGTFVSTGPIVIGDKRPGASIAAMAGMSNGVEWEAVRNRYLDPANLADPALPLVHPSNQGKVAKVYDKELIAWLGERYAFKGTSGEALATFDALPPEQQRIFLRNVYYAELREGGREYNSPDSTRFGSYLRGRDMIATLFPDKDAGGKDIVREGEMILFSGGYKEDNVWNPQLQKYETVFRSRDGAIRTLFGGDIEVMAPGGRVIVGVQGMVPGATAGLSTQGAGDIRLFSEKSLLMGLSRIMTTFGGDIFAWSEAGDINAGRGAKTTVVYTPPRRTYDNYGNIALAPQVPSTGAGIATLAPIPEVPAGDVDLIAPLGTIDAGEAGIRVSGNINLAALQVLNAANIQVKGDARGIPLPPVVNTSALAAASNASSAVVAQAAQMAERTRAKPVRDIPSIITSRLLGFGE